MSQIKIIPIASGSSGNCMLVEIENKRVIIDLGVTAKMLKSVLSLNGFNPSDTDAVLITHTHSDHVKGLPVCMKCIKAPVYASSATKATLCLDDVKELPYLMRTEICPGLFATAFRTSHDAAGSAGFLVETEQVRFGLVTDTGFISDDIKKVLAGADCIVIESNHDQQMLREGPYPVYLKRRILSDKGHLSNDACGEALQFFASAGTNHFLLAHLSRENNTPQTAYSSARKYLPDKNVTIDVLPNFGKEAFIFDV